MALAVAAVAAPALAQPVDNADVLAAARAFDDAQAKGDRAALDRLLAPEFLYVRGSGRLGDRRGFIAAFTAPGHSLDPFAIDNPMFLRLSSDAAIVGGEARIKGTEAGRPIADHVRYADTFVRRDGRWLVVYEQITELPE